MMEKFQFIVQKNILREFVSENISAGFAMDRRSVFMYGSNLEINDKQFVGCGLGENLSFGTNTVMAPNQITELTGNHKEIIDGLEFDIIDCPTSEAPCEMMFYITEYKSFCAAEVINHTLHNLYTPRGAKVRNGKLWASYIDQAINLFGDDVEISFGSHFWPTWGNKRIVDYWEKQRDLYKFIHDQTLRYMNLGYTYNELPQLIKLPKSLSSQFYNRDYYGTLATNIKAQYQLYLGWYDGNPVHLNELHPTELGSKYVEAIGGEDKVIEFAQEAYDKGEYQWCATLLNHLIFANPNNDKARELLAKCYTQMGYQQESAVNRNIYLSGAHDLRRL